MNGPGEHDATSKEPAWERAWSVEEVRKTSQNWSLAADAGLLRFLQEFSQQTISRTHEIEKQLDKLIHETKASDCHLHSIFNDFLMLSNTQFIENRVYDDEVEEPVPRHEAGEKQDQEKTREQKEAELIPKIQEAVNFGLQVLDAAFEQLDVKAGNSDSEEEEGNERVELILEPKDLYIDRPLPYLIGTQLFMEQEDVGLGDLSSEEGSVDSDRGSVIDSEEKDEAESSDDFGNHSEDDQKMRAALSDEEEDDGSDLFGDSEKEETEDKENLNFKRTRPTSFADELAARIKGDVPNEHEDQADEDMFKPPKLTDEDFSPFSTKGGLFSGGGGLFDDDESDLFAEAPKQDAKEKEAKLIVNESLEYTSSSPVKKVPAGAVSLFPGGEDIFSSSSVLAQKEREKTVAQKHAVDPKQAASASLFDDEDDIFSASNTKPSISAKANLVADLFVDEDGDSNLFQGRVPPTALDNPAKEAERLKENITKNKTEQAHEDLKTLSVPTPKKQTRGLFSDEEDSEQDLFSPKLNATKSKTASLPPARTSNAHSLFDEDEEDSLFDAVPTKKQITIKPPDTKTTPSLKKSLASSLLFSSDDEDHWNSIEQVKSSAEQSQKREATKPGSTEDQSGKAVKKISLFSEEEEDDDLFSITKESQKKHHRASLLFEEDSNDEGSMFNIKPSNTTSSQALEEVKQVNTTLLDEKEEKQLPFEKSEKTAIEETADTEEGRDGITGGMFHGTSMPEQKGKITEQEDIKRKDLFSASPPLQKEMKSKAKTIVSLFEEEEEEENTKDQLITRNPQEEVKSFEKSTYTRSTGVFQDEELLFSHKLQKDNDPDVDIFASTIKPVTEKSDPAKLSSGSELFGDEEDEDLFSAPKSKKPPKTPEKKMVKKNGTDTLNSSIFPENIKHDPNVSRSEVNEKYTGPVPVKTKEPASRIGQLQATLAINPASLLPGAIPKSAGPKSAVPDSSLSQPEDIQNVVTSAVGKKEEHGVSFDTPPQTDTLHSANKNRVKVTGKRRPPTRAGRRLASQSSGETNEISPLRDPHVPVSKVTTVIPSVRQSETTDLGTSNTKSNAAQKVSALRPTGDLFPGMDTSSSIKSLTPRISNMFDSDDLFTQSPVSKSTVNTTTRERPTDSLQSKPVKTDGKKTVLSGLDEQNDNSDLFQPVKYKSSKKTKSVPFLDEEGEDDLFGGQESAQKKDLKSKIQQVLNPDIQDIFEDDIFATEAAKPVRKKNEKKTAKSNLFDDSTDIFADLTVKPKEKKMKKKVETKSIFDDEMDDIFTSGNQKKMPKPKDLFSQSASEVKLENKVESKFDDPLNAFGDM